MTDPVKAKLIELVPEIAGRGVRTLLSDQRRELVEKVEAMWKDTPPANFEEDNYDAGKSHAFYDVLEILKDPK